MTVPLVCLFASILPLLNNIIKYMRQATKADNILDAVFAGTLRVNITLETDDI